MSYTVKGIPGASYDSEVTGGRSLWGNPLPLPFCRRAELVVLDEEVEGKRGPQWLPRPQREQSPSYLASCPAPPPTHWPPVCVGQGAHARSWVGFLLSGLI